MEETPEASKPVETGEPLRLLDQLTTDLRALPALNSNGFREITLHMQNFSKNFSSGAERIMALQEQVVSGGGLSSARLNEELEVAFREMGGTLTDLEAWQGLRPSFEESLRPVIDWGLALESESAITGVADLMALQDNKATQSQTFGAIIDDILQQLRPQILELIITGQETFDTVTFLDKRLQVDLKEAREQLLASRKVCNVTLGRMGKSIAVIDRECQAMEARGQAMKEVVFSMVQEIQFDDICSQRIGHIWAGCGVAQKSLLSGRADQKEEKRLFVFILHMLADQLDDLTRDLLEAVAAIQKHISQVAQLAREQVASVGAVRDAGRGLKHDLAGLTFEVMGLTRMETGASLLSSQGMNTMGQVVDEIQQLRRVLEGMNGMAGQLTEFNASLEISPGNNALTMTSEAMRALCAKIAAGVPEHGRFLEKADGDLQTVVKGFVATDPTRKQQTLTTQLQAMPRSLDRLKSSANAWIKAMNETMGETQAPAVQVMRLLADMDFHGAVQVESARLSEALRTLARAAAPGGEDEALAGLQWTDFEALRQIFTMESERRCFRNSYERLTRQSAAPEEAAGDTDVELF